ncbi:CHAT domain-containing protein [Hymenobacter puniceus]|uniref:CHAT domain-containing protein n=1 Tax=Hymenobacter sp. BT190 TaxID=2763505 RepID=UPI0016513D22|nr:CHAT domain-containing protein [Hymenobacter sp. BT190]MBC6699351.1 CHAT domain-containing protein [Hymenobacter sp. BT190]
MATSHARTLANGAASSNGHHQPERVLNPALLDWLALRALLELPELLKSASPAQKAQEQALNDFFGEEKRDELRLLAQTVAAAPPGLHRPHILFLPGMMASALTGPGAGGTPELVWANPARMADGIGELALTPAGNSREGVRTGPVDYRTYAPTLLALEATGTVEPWPYDWRQDLDETAAQLATYVQKNFRGQPLHLVAHSVGGLVAQRLIQDNRDWWDTLGADGQGGRLVLLGTPHYGTYATVPLLAGSDKVVRWLSKLDLKNSQPEVLRILNTFPSTYQLLPAPSRLPDDLQTLFHAGTWNNPAVQPNLLERGRLFQEKLGAALPLDPERTACIVGCNHRTLSRLSILAPGEFRYFEALAGDGRVPNELAVLPGVPAFYVDEDHGNLPTNPLVLKAVNELLAYGHTLVLPGQPIVTRTTLAPDSRWHRPIGDDLVASALEKMARNQQQNAALTSKAAEHARRLDDAIISQTLLRAAIGDDQPARNLGRSARRPARSAPTHQLALELICLPITKVAAPVLVMGHYQGAPPTSRLREMDRALNYWISEAQDHAMLSGELGHIAMVPAPALGGSASTHALLLAGMGEEGRFTHQDLHYLFTNIARTLLMLGCAEAATILVGARAGTMSEKQALISMLEGLAEVLTTTLNPKRACSPQLKKLTLVARSYDDGQQLARLNELLREVHREQPIAGLQLRYEQPVPCPVPAASTTTREQQLMEDDRPRDLPPVQSGPRITIERTDNQFRFSALVDGAVIPVREVKAQAYFPSSLAGRLMDSVSREEQETYGQLLTTALFPLDFQEHLNEPLTFILDRNTAGLPWEMACFAHRQRRELQYFGPQLQLTRQFRSMLSPRPGQPPARNESLRVLVIADPAPEPELQLPGARREGRAVVQMLSHLKQHWGLKLDLVERIGDTDCDPLEILALILDGNFDVVHFAGHGTFDATHPDCGGWVFGRRIFLSAREIFQARRVPRLVFANACFSAQVAGRQRASAAEELNRNLAGIAEAFFERGVRNYLGTGWPVNDALAELFAQEFYAQALVGLSAKAVYQPASYGLRSTDSPPTLSRAIARARTLIAHRGSTWGAYQHYGQANDLLLAR